MRRGMIAALAFGGGVLTLLLIIVSYLRAPPSTPTVVPQPPPATLGGPAPALAASYRAAQMDPGLSDEAKVWVAVDTYFLLKYESRVRDQALDLGVVVDRTGPKGRTLHNYELGRLQYSLLWWRLDGLTFVAYDYRPSHGAITVSGDTAMADIRPIADTRVELDGYTRTDTVGEVPHVLRAVRSAEGWRLTQDDYDDEMRQLYPVGTDWARLIAAAPPTGGGEPAATDGPAR
ncbi:MAG: hypothetical protein M0Z94_16075 [Dehalococcoidales bacterium]|nr:hypothetical protein [Dehalococcoidales bacterium]